MRHPTIFLFFLFLAPAITASATLRCNTTSLPNRHTLRTDKLTVLLSGYSTHRLPLLHAVATTYSTLPIVSSVLILWGNPSTPSHLLSHHFPPTSTSITLIRHPTPSLNSRFHPHPEIRTLPVAICDDDVEIDPKSLSFALKTWQSHQDQIVGFFPRSHDYDLLTRSWIYTFNPERFSLLLTKFMILSLDFLYAYSCGGGGGGGGGTPMEAARRVVERRRNCEDLLMNFVVAMESGKGPVAVAGAKVRDWGDSRNEEWDGEEGKERAVGLSAREGHWVERGKCIREFHRVFGRMPLKYSYGLVVEGVREQGLCRKKGRLVPCDRFR